jgi:hypothetical protein
LPSFIKNDTDIIISKINERKLLIPYPEIYDTNYICYTAELIPQIINLMEFYMNNKNDKIKYFIDYSLEIVNQVIREEYYKKAENKNERSVPNEYLNKYFKNNLKQKRNSRNDKRRKRKR